MAGSWQVINGGRFYQGDPEAEVVGGSALDETLFGQAGDDQLDGAGGQDSVDGGHGNDILRGGAGDDQIWDGAGNLAGAPPGNGLIGRDQLFGDDGDDILRIWSPDTGDVADGGAGNDLFEVRFNYNVSNIPGDPPVVFVLVSGGSSVVQLNGVNTVAVNNVERLLFVGNSNPDFITGGSFDDVIAGNGGNDVLKGGAGNDRLDSGTGTVDLDGGAGFDAASFDLSGTAQSLTIRNGATIELGGLGTIRSVESLDDFTLGSGDDVVELTQAASATLRTGAGNDRVASVSAIGLELGQGSDQATLGSGNDYVDPGLGSDTVRLGAGNDQLDYTSTGTRIDSAGDQVWGEGGDDRIYTTSAADGIDAGFGDDQVFAGGGVDTVAGNGGDDLINGEGGADVLQGGAGNDTIETDYDYYTDTTTRDDDQAYGGLGNDRIQGGLGADILSGGAGDDVVTATFRTWAAGAAVVADAGTDTIDGGAGIDTLVVGGLSNAGETYRGRVVLGLTTVVRANGVELGRATGFERLDASLFGNGGHYVVGGGLADRLNLSLSQGNDEVYAGAGDDFVDVGRGVDRVASGAGADQVQAVLSGADQVNLGDGDDTLTLFGMQASDGAPSGGALYQGGAGFDILVLNAGARGVSLAGDALRIEGVTVGRIAGFERFDIRGSVANENFNGTNRSDRIALDAGNDVSRGWDGHDVLDGGAGNDVLEGGLGNDELIGGTGADILRGGIGRDTLRIQGDGLADTLDGGGGLDRLIVGVGWAGPVVMSGSFASTVQVTAAGALVATITAVESIELTGSSGNDSLFGAEGDDLLRGAQGFDQLRGNGGNDTIESIDADGIDGGAGTADFLRLFRSGATTGFFFDLTDPSASQVLSDGTSVSGIERVEFQGGGTGDRLTGGRQADLLYGNNGDDRLVGAQGDDRLEGGTGRDEILGGRGADTIVSVDADAIDGGLDADRLVLLRGAETRAITLSIAAPATSVTLVDGTTVLGIEQLDATAGSGADQLTGGALNDVLRGQGGADRLVGGGGADVLTGGADADVLTGGAGADRFRFATSGDGGVDRVTDFSAADFVVVARSGFLVAAGAVPVLVANATPLASQAAATFLFDTDTGRLSLDADGTGAAAAVALVDLANGAAVASLSVGQLLFE